MGKFIFFIEKIPAIVQGIISFVFYFIRDLVFSIIKFINYFLNFQWNSGLNVFQNLAYNLYIPNTEGKPSMHTTLVFFASYITFLACLYELKKFNSSDSYQLSTGFWTVVVGISGLVVTAFTTYARKKMNSNDGKSGLQELGSNQSESDIPTDPYEEEDNLNRISDSFKEDVRGSGKSDNAEVSKKKISKKLKRD
jgi:hypothetical protein